MTHLVARTLKCRSIFLLKNKHECLVCICLYPYILSTLLRHKIAFPGSWQFVAFAFSVFMESLQLQLCWWCKFIYINSNLMLMYLCNVTLFDLVSILLWIGIVFLDVPCISSAYPSLSIVRCIGLFSWQAKSWQKEERPYSWTLLHCIFWIS
jgi:hypothetical protein